MIPLSRLIFPMVLPLALALGGCGEHEIGADSSVKQSVSTSTESKIESTKEVKQNRTAKATVSMPAVALMTEVLRTYVATEPMRSTDPHVEAARAILAVMRPAIAWPVTCFGCSAQAAWAHGEAARIDFANLLMTELAGHLPAQSVADPTAARKAILAAYLAIPTGTIEAAQKQARNSARGAFMPDFSGGDGVHFLIGTNDYKGGPAGWTWAQNGVTWYGDGQLSGQKIEIAMDSAIDTGTTQTSGTGSTTGTNAENGNSAQAGVK